MTLIVGIRCKDGVVLAADGVATYESSGQATIRQPTTKLAIINERIIVGVSGGVGLGQLITDRIQTLSDNSEFSGTKCRSSADAMRKLRDSMWEDIGHGLQRANIAQQIIGPSARQGAASRSLVGLRAGRSPCLVHFDEQCSPEEATERLPFVAIGSGQPIADPFLAFLRERFWPDKTPTLAEGIFAVTWTLRHAIQTNPGGIGAPFEVTTLAKQGAEYRARRLDPTELDEHEQNVKEAEGHLSSYPARLSGEVVAEGEPPPTPPEQ